MKVLIYVVRKYNETAEISKQIENVIQPYLGKEIVGFRTEITRSHHGGIAKENSFRKIIEIVPKEERTLSADDLVNLWKPLTGDIKGLKKLIIQKSRWGQSSGSAVEVLILENNDSLRVQTASDVLDAMKKYPELINAEIDQPLSLTEDKIDIDRDKVKRLAINPLDIATTFRASLEGEILFELASGNEHIDVCLSVMDSAKSNMQSILEIPVENRANYLAPLGDLLTIQKTNTATSINRRDSRRVTSVLADLKAGSGKTPVQIAQDLENGIFKQVVSQQPSTSLNFDGEVADTRESKNDLRNAIVMVTILIFAILVMLFNSVSRTLIIMSINSRELESLCGYRGARYGRRGDQ
ncbi:MAG: efflux RND transporter permease subunit [Gammaproteobacteria bacterium]|nr:efflux RND transporter permease subunit [Gammaproteobacteria bacterium]